MMPSLIENLPLTYQPSHSREQAAALLAELRRLYRSLSLEKRAEVRSRLMGLASAQLDVEVKEK